MKKRDISTCLVSRSRGTLRRVGVGLVCAGVVGSLAQRVHAQSDINPALPNVLLLVDTSGSMERMIDGRTVEEAGQACNPNAATEPNRWGALVQVLTGSLPGYRCASMAREASQTFATYPLVATFTGEYGITVGSTWYTPYDLNYLIPFHRPLTSDSGGSCAYAPGVLPGSVGNGVATDFPAAAVVMRYLSGRGSGSCTFNQQTDGILDLYDSAVRFGLMMFDNDPSSKTGVDTSFAVAPNPFLGAWSYYDGWKTGVPTSPITGYPPNCGTPTVWELGARNPAAPPWEGRFIQFPDPAAGQAAVTANNNNVQTVINAMRPYGSTPITAMMDDARYYFRSDGDGPKGTPGDAYVKGSCRDQYIILLTDGIPNMDMRPECVGTGTPAGKCPYTEEPENIADDLARNWGVKTYVIGFALSTVASTSTPGATVKCSNLDPAVDCLGTIPAERKPCCKLQSIAKLGGTTTAYFADSQTELRTMLDSLVGSIASLTTRTSPVYSPIVTAASSDPSAASTAASTFLSLMVRSPLMNSGNIQRKRQVCQFASGGSSVLTPSSDAAVGDDFAANLNSHLETDIPRRFLTYQPPVIAGTTNIDLRATIRPFLPSTVDDGIPAYGSPNAAERHIYGTASTVIGAVSAAALKPNACVDPRLAAEACKNLALNFVFAQDYTTGLSSTDTSLQRRRNSAFGPVFHSTPAVISRPTALIRDEAYEAFAQGSLLRPTIVYVATNDGLLHAFWADVTSKKNNEYFAFMPPAVLYGAQSAYPNVSTRLLDGAPIVRDVVWTRSADQVTDKSAWHTMLVAGFGKPVDSATPAGYYALDVTEPNPKDLPTKGPQFRWQLNKVKAGDTQIFGANSATAAITTLYFIDPSDLSGIPREVGVAILPGGIDDGLQTTECSRDSRNGPLPLDTNAIPSTGYPARAKVRCWGASTPTTPAVVPGRSVTIVRLETGEVIRTFMRSADRPATMPSVRIIDSPLDSPMTGVPVVYPSDVGSVGQKFFIGDADGTIWRFDVSSRNPASWKAELFFDPYGATTYAATTLLPAGTAGQPVQLAPLLSLDRGGGLALHFATGDQETYTASGFNYVFSLGESVQGAKLRAKVNWYIPFTSGERVVGPMAVFDSKLFFASFAPATVGSVCGGGTAYLWARDYVTPQLDTDLSLGGAFRWLGAAEGTIIPKNFNPSATDSTLAGKIIPGVSINVTASCADASQTGADTYVSGAQHTQVSSIGGGGYSLFMQVGSKSNTSPNAVQTKTYALTSPNSPTIVDSWAAVTE